MPSATTPSAVAASDAMARVAAVAFPALPAPSFDDSSDAESEPEEDVSESALLPADDEYELAEVCDVEQEDDPADDEDRR